MASISGDGRAGSGEALARLKDLYQSRERELENRHRDEVRDLREAHRGEMDKLRNETQKRVETAQEEANTKLSQKDIQHQKEIDALKSMYSKRLAEAKRSSD